MSSARKKFADHDPGLQTGQRGTDAEVRALAEADVALGVSTIKPKFVGVLEM